MNIPRCAGIGTILSKTSRQGVFANFHTPFLQSLALAPFKLRRRISVGLAIAVFPATVLAQQFYTLTDLGTLGGNSSTGSSINASGEVTGGSLLADNTTIHAFLYSNNRMIDLGTLGGSSSVGRGINDSGEVTGYSLIAGDTARHAFLYSAGRMIDLGTLGGTESQGHRSMRPAKSQGIPPSPVTPHIMHFYIQKSGCSI